MKQKLSLLFLLAFLVAISSFSLGCGQKMVTQSVSAQIDAEGYRITHSLSKSGYNISDPGALICVIDPATGLNYEKAFGVSDVATGRTLEVTDRYQIGSITKTFTITVLLLLAEEGKLSLDDKLSKYYPAIPNASLITLRDLASMRTGIADYADMTEFETALTANPSKHWDPQDLVDIALLHPSAFTPESDCKYSNTNTIILGMIIESVTGHQISAEVKTRILDPLHMTNTSFMTDEHMPGGSTFFHGYEFLGLVSQIYTDSTEKYNLSCAWAAGNMVSDLHDMKIWADALGIGSLLTSAMQQERLNMHDMKLVQGVQWRYGVGMIGVGDFIGHSGDTYAFHNTCYYNPATGMIIIVVVDFESISEDYVMDKIANIVHPGSIPGFVE